MIILQNPFRKGQFWISPKPEYLAMIFILRNPLWRIIHYPKSHIVSPDKTTHDPIEVLIIMCISSTKVFLGNIDLWNPPIPLFRIARLNIHGLWVDRILTDNHLGTQGMPGRKMEPKSVIIPMDIPKWIRSKTILIHFDEDPMIGDDKFISFTSSGIDLSFQCVPLCCSSHFEK